MYNEWCTIESDPGVFTEMIKRMGAPSVQVEQIYSLEDDELFTKVQPHIYGFIFLFKWTKQLEKKESLTVYDEDLFFARQIVNNACATQAILSIVLNAPITITSHLKEFHDFSKDLSCENRGLALSNSQAIRNLHNSFSRAEPFIFKEDKKAKKSDAFHFVSYVPHKHHLYELDGLQPGPILLAKFEQQNDWIVLAKQEICKRIEHYAEKQIRFNLMVICEDLSQKAQSDIALLQIERANLCASLKTLGKEVDEEFLSHYPEAVVCVEGDEDKWMNRLNEIVMEVEDKQLFIEEQARKASERKEQNVRRKHNYVPLIIQMLKMLAKKNMLVPLIEKAANK